MRRPIPIFAALLCLTLVTACVTIAPPASSEAPVARPSPAAPQATVAPPTPAPSRQPTTTPSPTLHESLQPPASPEADDLAWHPCAGGLECATLHVPIDYENAAAGTVGLSLIRHVATNENQRIGSLVMNPGGPGGSGVDWVRTAWTTFGPDLTDRFDIVGFDPRGIGESDAIRCLDERPQLSDAFPEDAAEEQSFVDLAKEVTAACERNSAELLPFVGTENVARDLDNMRAALGDEKLTYFGFSYGTFIGATYAELFPNNIRTMVLDGPVDPELDFTEFVKTQSAASQSELDEFLDRCAEASSCEFSADENPKVGFDALMERFDQGPIDGVTASVALSAMYQELVVDDDAGLETILSLAEGGVTWPMAQAGSWATDARLLDGYDAVNCLDYPMPRTVEGFNEIADEAAQVAPDIGAWNTYTYFDCAFWPAEPTRVPGPLTASGAPPILVIAATGDPSTPYEWGVSLADQLESGILVTRNGDGHTSFHFSNCVRQIATEYLLTLTTPADDTTCD